MTMQSKKLTWVDGLLYLLIAAMAGLSVFGLFRAFSAQTQVVDTFKGWYDDKAGYIQGLAEQKKNDKPMLVYFYATWCPYCKSFTQQILSTDETREFLKRYIRVRVAPDNGPAEQALMTEYGATGYPSFFVLLPNKPPQKIEVHLKDRFKTSEEFNQSVQEVAEVQTSQ